MPSSDSDFKWTVKITDAAGKLINRKNALSDDDKRVIQSWGKMVGKNGPDSLRKGSALQAWRDHDLSGPWLGFRASSFSSAGRIIYRVIEDTVYVAVIRLTTTHEYGPPTESELTELHQIEKIVKTEKEREQEK
jgi:hypothetical protein